MCPRRIIAARGRRWGMAHAPDTHRPLRRADGVRRLLPDLGIGYNTDGFQEKSGIHARPSTAETLAEVTAYFAGNLAACADDVPRDESGVCTSGPAGGAEPERPPRWMCSAAEFPFLRAETGGAKASPAPGR